MMPHPPASAANATRNIPFFPRSIKLPAMLLPVLCAAAALAALMASPAPLSAQEVRASEDRQVITTYPFGDPDPVPVLAGSDDHIYPYFKFDQYHHNSTEEKWKVVTLENEHIRVSMLPEVGGKIWGATEKSTGGEFIYRNEVLKFRNIALRGPWTSGGIEFNFGITGHTPATSTPVDYRVLEHEDGSASYIAGGLDLPSRTQWRVTVTVRPDQAFFETESFWYNPTALDQSYYVWMNAAVEASDDLQFFFPGTHYVGHSGDAHPWPVDEEGRNLSYYRNNDFGSSKSYHILGKKTDFYGGYWHDDAFGFGNWSRYSDMPGKKLWIWSLARSGGIWEDLLTDTDGQYVEVQSGRLFSQASGRSVETPFDYAGFPPGASDRWEELWFPVRETGGLSAVSPQGVLHVEPDEAGNTMAVRLMALQPVDDELKISMGEEVVSSQAVSLAPMEVHRDTLDLAGRSEEEIRELKIVLGAGKLSYIHSPETKGFDRPLETRRKTEKRTVSRLYQQGRNQADNREYAAAMATFSEVIEQDPAHLDARAGLAELYYRRGEYAKALEHSRQALSYNTYHPRANFMHGTIKKRTGEPEAALEALGWAARSPQYRSSAYASMAELYLRTGQTERAVEFGSRALNFNWNNIKAYKVLAVAYREQGDAENAQTILDKLLDLDPLNHFARFERYLLEESEERLEDFTSLIRNELPHETYLELAAFYAEAGRPSDALRLLEHAPDQPMVWYWRAYLSRDRAAAQSRDYLQRATAASPYLVFPFRSESIPVLQWAREQGDAWQNDYYLGLLYWGKGRIAEAGELFAGLKNRPDYAPFYLTRGALREALGAPDEAVLEEYRTARRMDPDSWRSRHALIRHYMRTGRPQLALEQAEAAYRQFPDRDPIEMGYARALLATGNYDEGADLLDRMRILPYEGASEGRVLFERTHTFRALQQMEAGDFDAALQSLEKAQRWPEELGVGKPYNPDVRMQRYLQAAANAELGNSDRAGDLFEEVADYTRDHPDRRGAGLYFGALALRQTGQEAAGRSLLEEWQSEQPGSRMSDWALARYTGDQAQAERIAEEILAGQMNTGSEFPLLIEAARTLEQIR